ncbi:DUF2868 domain-containing protein [Alteromonas sp. ASW11-36]|uniref:DUF2868 domain-containing protein n=1 Tax=Alteromonas arenosi TaxID=3055817 RepID=A0ABT7SZH2_9ALTE|nr:DUF2868 domain-containing protein [Alteromonas sp. ASW11-36]MDM7861593.1 DUF2868 domain-containing protein [Alteromonas sp. ASW11-36]
MTNTATQISKPILFLSAALGFLLTLAVMNGDASGRVNLLYLLLIFVAVPLFGALLSIVGLLSRDGINSAKLVKALPIWTNSQRANMRMLERQQLSKPWYFVQSQAAALAYSIASLAAFIVLLLTTDINFVWRSTLLSADDLLPILRVVAAPWWFWESAQPTMTLLEQTRDSRLLNSMANAQVVGQWWLFVLATQITYAFLLRGILLTCGRMYLATQFAKWRVTHQQQSKLPPSNAAEPTVDLAEPTQVLPTEYVLLNYANLPLEITKTLGLGNAKAIDLEQRYNTAVVVLVKAWEPPLGELHDFMRLNHGVLCPVYYRHEAALPIPAQYLDEWRRFTLQAPNWQLYLAPQGIVQ